jgi:hypothetical protein
MILEIGPRLFLVICIILLSFIVMTALRILGLALLGEYDEIPKLWKKKDDPEYAR